MQGTSSEGCAGEGAVKWRRQAGSECGWVGVGDGAGPNRVPLEWCAYQMEVCVWGGDDGQNQSRVDAAFWNYNKTRHSTQ